MLSTRICCYPALLLSRSSFLNPCEAGNDTARQLPLSCRPTVVEPLLLMCGEKLLLASLRGPLPEASCLGRDPSRMLGWVTPGPGQEAVVRWAAAPLARSHGHTRPD